MGVELDEELTAGLKALSRRHGTTLFMTLLAGWAAVLAGCRARTTWWSARRWRTGTARDRGADRFFVNTLALRVDLSGTPTVAELLGRVKERRWRRSSTRTSRSSRWWSGAAGAQPGAHPALPGDVRLAERAVGSVESAGAAGCRAGDVAVTTAKFDLTLSLAEAGGRRLSGAWSMRRRCSSGDGGALAGYLRRVLEGWWPTRGRRWTGWR